MQRLEKENLKKDVRILQLEKQLQAAVFSRAKVRRFMFKLAHGVDEKIILVANEHCLTYFVGV